MPSVLLGPTFLLHFLSFVLNTAAFSFAVSPPTQCDPFTVSWSGGTPPYDILITPALDSPRKFSIPSLPDNGSFVIQLPLKAGSQFVVSMSDADGFATGGISDLYTVGKSIRGSSCSTDTPSLSFLFDLPSPLNQCKPYNVTWDPGAVLPVTITGLIPLGKPVQLNSGIDTTNFFVWDQANVPSQTRIIFYLNDKDGRFGGSSNVLTVGGSDDSSCINEQSPQSTASAGPSNTQPGSPSSTGSPQATVTITPNKGVSAAAIGGAVAGGLVACLILGTLAAFFFRTYLPNRRASSRYSKDRPYNGDSTVPPHSGNPLSQFPLDANSPGSRVPSNWTTFNSSEPQGLSNDYAVEPFTPALYHQQYQSSFTSHGDHTIPVSPSAVARDGRTSSSKSSMDYPPNRPARFILHADAEEEIELPPQYNDRLTRQQQQNGPLTSDSQV